MLDRAFRLSSSWSYFSKEVDCLKSMFSRLKYPEKEINSTLTPLIAVWKASDQPVSFPSETNAVGPLSVVLPVKDQVSTYSLRGQLKDLSRKIHISIQPVFVNHKIEHDLKLREIKPQL